MKNERQNDLYNYLLRQDDYVSQREIYENVKGYTWSSQAWDKCSSIRDDMVDINNNPDYDRIIVMKNRCFKIGDSEDVKQFYNARIRKLKRYVEQCNSLKSKVLRNGQGHFNEEGDLTFYETFIQEIQGDKE